MFPITKKKLMVVLSLVIFGFAQYYLKDVISLDTFKYYNSQITTFAEQSLLASSIAYILVFFVVCLFVVPMMGLMFLIAGYLFSFPFGLALASCAFLIHALLMTALIRYGFRRYVQNKFHNVLKKINEQMQKKGVFYVVFLRMSLVTPSSIINCAAALTKMNIIIFALVSWVCTLPIMSVFVYSGRLLLTANSIFDLFSLKFALALICLAIISFLPLVIKSK